MLLVQISSKLVGQIKFRGIRLSHFVYDVADYVHIGTRLDSQVKKGAVRWKYYYCGHTQALAAQDRE